MKKVYITGIPFRHLNGKITSEVLKNGHWKPQPGSAEYNNKKALQGSRPVSVMSRVKGSK
jgi:hypothetical protein